MTWNVNGLTEQNTDLRLEIINNLQKDIVVLCETHHQKDTVFNVKDYCWFGHPRLTKHINSRRYFGGDGVLVKYSFLNNYKVTIIDKSMQDMLVLMFESKIHDIRFLIFACYLPPENSPHGRDSSEFVGHILAIIYRYNFVDTFFICGDLNSRIGNKNDYIESLDHVSHQTILDHTCNGHGENFIEFFKKC